MKTSSRLRAGALGVLLVVSSNLLSIDAKAAPLVWGSGSWGDTWVTAVGVPSLSPLALWLLAAALAVSMATLLRRRPAPGR